MTVEFAHFDPPGWYAVDGQLAVVTMFAVVDAQLRLPEEQPGKRPRLARTISQRYVRPQKTSHHFCGHRHRCTEPP